MKQKKILVADRSKIFLDLECSYFQNIGCKTIGADSGEDALRLAAEERPDLILIDYNLPDLDGAEVCRKLKDNFITRNTPVIIMAAESGMEIEKTSRQAGATDFLAKPVKQRQLIYRSASLLNIPLRFDVSFPVAIMNLEGGNLKIQARSVDMSESGIKVESGLRLEKEALLSLELTLPGSSQSLRFEGKVMRVEKSDKNKYYYGIRFADPGERAKGMLQNYLSSLSARINF